MFIADFLMEKNQNYAIFMLKYVQFISNCVHRLLLNTFLIGRVLLVIYIHYTLIKLNPRNICYFIKKNRGVIFCSNV